MRGLGFEVGGNRGPRRGAVHGRGGDQPSRWPRRHRRFGSDPGRSEAGAGGRPAGDRRRAGQGPRRPAAGVPALRGRLPREGLSPARDRHTVRPGRGPVASLLLCWLRHDRDRGEMAAARPLDAGVGSAAGATLRSADLPDGGRPARAAVSGGRRSGPGDAGRDPERLRRHTFKVAKTLSMSAAAEVPVSVDAEAIVVSLDSTFIRSCEAGERHLEVRIGNVETASGRRQAFCDVAKTDTDLAGLIRRSLDAVGRTEGTALTAFTDGCLGLRRILLDAGVAGLPILDWFHVAMRLQHLTQIAGGLSSDGPERAAAKAVIVEEVERLRWRLWNGKAKDAKVSIERIRAVKHHFRGEPGSEPPRVSRRRICLSQAAIA